MFFKVEKPETIKFYEFIKEHRPFIVFDTETSGLKAKTDYIIQFSANRYEVINGIYQKTNSINEYIKIPIYMDQSVVDVHGITNEFLNDKPTENEVFPKIKEFLEIEGAVITGYNALKFDVKFLDEMYKRQGCEFKLNDAVDVYQVAKENIYPKEIDEHSLKLKNVVSYLGITDDINFHSADEDIHATWLCAIELMKYHKKNFMISFAEKDICEILRMSKYKKSSSVNRIYVDIMLGNEVEKVYYDIPKKGWCDCPDKDILSRINVYKLQEDAEEIINKKGFKSLDKFEGIYDKRKKGLDYSA